ncbi:MAG: zinc-binding alcohol dehydrogenase family protein [Bacteroidales bacterium]|nr:zinc-binding alcohol dehydrogenase family protein [Bacteroidales bacterium]
MKAIEIKEPGKAQVVEVEKPKIKNGEVLVKLEYVGFCGSDLNTYRGGNAMVKYPRIPGHEIGATIVEISDDVPAKFSIGQTVTINPYTNCGHCDSCKRGRVNACENNETLGVQRNGAMQEFISVPWQKIIPCDKISARNAALIEPMSVGFHAVDRGRVTDTDVVMVIGCGMVGLGAVVRAVLRGATVIAADLDEEKLALAKQLGATFTYNTSSEWNLPAPDVVIEAVGATPTYQLAINKVAFTGRVVCIGYAKNDVPLTTSLFVKKELDIMGSRNANPSDFEAVINYLSKTNAPIDSFISKIIEPSDADKALNDWNLAPSKIFRILVKWN